MADSAESPAAAAPAAAPGPDGGEGAAKKPTAKELRMQKKAEEVRGAFFSHLLNAQEHVRSCIVAVART